MIEGSPLIVLCDHAAYIIAYIQDCLETDYPWLLWEEYQDGAWRSLEWHPKWESHCQYRRKIHS